MSTNIVQSVHQKCLELHNCVPIFLKIRWGGLQPPFHLYCLMMCFKKLRNFCTVKMSPASVWYHPLLKAKKKK